MERVYNCFGNAQKLAGMTGTAVTEAAEFSNIYNLEVTEVPPNRPINRQDNPDVVFRTEAGAAQSPTCHSTAATCSCRVFFVSRHSISPQSNGACCVVQGSGRRQSQRSSCITSRDAQCWWAPPVLSALRRSRQCSSRKVTVINLYHSLASAHRRTL